MPGPVTTASPSTLGQGISLPAGKSNVQVVNPRPGEAAGTASSGAESPVSGKPAPRPGYTGGPEDPAGGPSVLEYEQTGVLLKDLPDDQFREWIVKVAGELDDLGLNRGNNPADYEKLNPRAEAYLDIVTWDAKNRDSYRDSSSEKQSSCGMFIRDLWWLCGCRGGPLMDEPYSSGIITELLVMCPGLRITWHPKTNKSTWSTGAFVPAKGDVLYLYKQSVNAAGATVSSQHIFTITDLDKDIALEDGKPVIRNRDAEKSLADAITFTSVDGGQGDGPGQDGKRKAHSHWGCHATKRVMRPMALKAGQWPAVNANWPIPGKAPGRPIVGWIPIATMKHLFTAPLIMPHRKSRPAAPGSPGSGATGPVQPHGGERESAEADPVSRHAEWDSIVADNQGKSMPDLLNVFASAGYKKTLDIRNWYASGENPKRESFGLRPRIPMDAILHRNEGASAGWILSDCERAGISPQKSADQYELIKSTIGIKIIA